MSQQQRPRERQKCSKFDLQTNNFARASPFFVHSLLTVLEYDVKMLIFTFSGGRTEMI